MGLLFYIMFFSFSLVVEIYSLLEWRDDIISIIGTSIVFLASLYLLLDALKVEIQKIKDEYFSRLDVKRTDLSERDKQLTDINQLFEQQTKEINKIVDDKIGETKAELLKRQKNSVEVIIKAQKSFTEAIIKNNNGYK